MLQNSPRNGRGNRPAFREILKANPRLQNNLWPAAFCFALVALCFLGLAVYGILVLIISR